MTTLNMYGTGSYFYDGITLTGNAYIIPAAEGMTAMYAPAVVNFTVGSPRDIKNQIYPSIEDCLDWIFTSTGNPDDILTFINTAFGTSYTKGDLIYVDNNTYTALAGKQSLSAKLTSIDGVTLASGKQLYATGSNAFGTFDSTSYGRGLNNLANQTALQSAVGISTVGLTGVYSDLTGKPSLSTVATSGSYTDLSNKPTIPSVARTVSTSTLSLVGTGATGTQISSTKDATVHYNVSTSTTSSIGGPSTSLVALKICATNSSTEGDWTTIATLENDQTITLALALNSVQVVKSQLSAEVPLGWYVKLVNSGSGTHTETFITGQKVIYG